MKNRIAEVGKQSFKLINFLAWYLVALAAVFYVLPLIGLFLEGRFDVLAPSVKFFSILGFFMVVAVWQIAARKERLKTSLKHRNSVRNP